MDCSIEEYEEETEERTQVSNKTNGLGFSGGPTWHHPEEEIEFYPINEVEDESLDEDSDIESCASVDNFRLAMIENYIETHDIMDDDFDLFYGLNGSMDYALSQPPPSVIIERDPKKSKVDSDPDDHYSSSDHSSSHCSDNNNSNNNNGNMDFAMSKPPPSIIIERESEKRKVDSDIDDHYSSSDHSFSHCSSNNSSNYKSLRQVSPLSLTKKNHSWIRPIAKRRRRPDKVCISSETTTINEPKFDRFREATMCVPFEYTTKHATFYIRRPYGLTTVPELFRVLSPHVTDEEYEMKSLVSSSKTIQVAISISADRSMMLLYGSAGVRYKSNPNDLHCEKWVNVPDIGFMDVPLGYVNRENRDMGNRNIEYSLDEIVEEAMFVREQYCSTIVSAALAMEQRQLSDPAKAKAPSPPSLAKSNVSTPARSSYYYDGSSNDTKIGEQEGDIIKGRKLDFLRCISPSLMTKGSIGTTSTNHPLKQRKRRRQRQVYRLFQRVVIVIGFYICGIFLVGNLSGVDYHLPSSFVAELLPPSYKTVLAMFLNTVDEQQQRIKDISGDKRPTTGVAEHIEREDHYASTQIIAFERDSIKRNLETTQELVREQMGQINALSEKYNVERTKTEELQKGKKDAVSLVQNLLHETETLAVDLEIEQGQRRKLEQTVRELEIQMRTLMQEKIKMEAALDAQTLKEESEEATTEYNREESSEVILVELMDVANYVGENISLQNSIYEIHERRRDDFISQNKIEVFARSFKSAITKNVNKMVRGNQGFGNDDRSEMDLIRDTLNNPLLAQHTLKFLDDNTKIREMLKSSTQKVLKQSKESSEIIRRNVKKNIEEATVAGIRKIDYGQEAIKVVGGFAKAKLQSMEKRARIFLSKKWRQVRSYKSCRM